MHQQPDHSSSCVIIGASHAGVNCAFALRRAGWKGAITLLDADPELPYHRPPLSKRLLAGNEDMDNFRLRPLATYQQERIDLQLGITVTAIDRVAQTINLSNGNQIPYQKLVLATGASPYIPPIVGIQKSPNLYYLRSWEDVKQIKHAISTSTTKRVVLIGGGYIGLETAASLKKMGAQVIVLEKANRLLPRVTSVEVAQFFASLHTQNGVSIYTGKEVIECVDLESHRSVKCRDGSAYPADVIIVGVGIKVDTTLAASTGLKVGNGIQVDEYCRTNDPHIYAIGDCTEHYNDYYQQSLRLECVQNAVDQAKVAAAHMTGKEVKYNAIPRFWSDQYEVKLQIVGLSEGYQKAYVRKEIDAPHQFSVWYFKEGRLLAVDAVNHAKAFVLGGQLIKGGYSIHIDQLIDPNIPLKPANLILK